MAIFNGYSVDAYCDCDNCRLEETPDGKYCKQEMISAAGESYAECAAEIRHYGWWLSRDKKHAIAPGHKKPTKGNL